MLSLPPVFPPTSNDTTMFRASEGVSAEKRKLAYFYALIGFVFTLVKSQSDLQHLYIGRRASVRCQGELVASIYEKTLVRTMLIAKGFNLVARL